MMTICFFFLNRSDDRIRKEKAFNGKRFVNSVLSALTNDGMLVLEKMSLMLMLNKY